MHLHILHILVDFLVFHICMKSDCIQYSSPVVNCNQRTCKIALIQAECIFAMRHTAQLTNEFYKYVDYELPSKKAMNANYCAPAKPNKKQIVIQSINRFE